MESIINLNMTNVQGRHEPMGSTPNAQEKRKSAAISSFNSETNTKTYEKNKKECAFWTADLYSIK